MRANKDNPLSRIPGLTASKVELDARRFKVPDSHHIDSMNRFRMTAGIVSQSKKLNSEKENNHEYQN